MADPTNLDAARASLAAFDAGTNANVSAEGLRTAIAEVDRLTAERDSAIDRAEAAERSRDYWQAHFRVLAAPGCAGPPSYEPGMEDDEDAPAVVRARAGMIKILIWHFGMLAKAHPAPNYLSVDFAFPDALSADDLEEAGLTRDMADLAGYHLEIAAVKPGGTGPSRMRDALVMERDELRARLDRAEKELRCERGEWAPDPWVRFCGGWRRENPLREVCGAGPGQWYYLDKPGRRHGPYPGPFAAIEAAEAARREKG